MFKQKKYLAFLVAAFMLMGSFMAPLPVKAAAGVPVAITSLVPSSTSIAAGQTIQVRISTTIAANSVIAAYDNTTLVGTMQTNNGTIKEWVLVIAPKVSQTVTFYVGATAEVNSLTATYPLYVTVGGSAGAVTTPITTVTPGAATFPAVTGTFNPSAYNPNDYNSYNPNGSGSYNPNNYNSYTPPTPVATPAPTPTPEPREDVEIIDITETSAGRVVTLTVTTGADANNVWVNFDRHDGVGKYVQGTLSGENTFTVKFSPADTVADIYQADVQTVVVSSNSAYRTNGADNQDYEIQFTSSIAPPARAVINGVSSSKSVLYTNDYTDLTISTNADTEFVWVTYNSGQTVNATVRANSSGTTKTWTARVTPNSTQTLTIYAGIVSGDENAATRNYSITVRNEEEYGDRATISSANAEWEDNNYRSGDSADIHVEVTTNSYANYVWFRYDGQTYNLSRSSSSSNRWTTASGGRNVDYDSSEDSITVYASESSRSYYDDSENVDIGDHNGSGGNGDEIEDWEVEGDSSSPVYLDIDDGYFDVWVETDNSVDWVRASWSGNGDSDEDEDYTPSGNEWNITLDMPDVADRYTLYIDAYDGNDDRVDRVSITIDVN